MRDLQGGTIKERLARLETMLCNHIRHHEIRDKWMMRILATLVSGLILMVTPGFVKWLATVV